MDYDYVTASKALSFIPLLPLAGVPLVLTDPPYYEIVGEEWDHQWASEDEYVRWLVEHFLAVRPGLTPTGSLLFFAGLGKHGMHPLFKVVTALEASGLYTFRNWVTWKKRKGYGKPYDYLYCREELLWFSASSVRTEVTFNIPLLNVKRGYAGFNKKYPAKSEYKRVSNVWDDIPELMKPKIRCEKPEPLLERLVCTHSNPGDLVVDFFAGRGTTGVAARRWGREFRGCDFLPKRAEEANARVAAVIPKTLEECRRGFGGGAPVVDAADHDD